MAKITGLDGHARPADEERRLNLVIAAVLGSPAGQEVMQYLRSITTNVASGPEISDQRLRHLEGQRYLTALLQQRIDLGHKENRKHGSQGTGAKPDPAD